ncbi:hsp90 co-chaperone Cdc37-like [Diadema antillarum]|uniref:hsp90 co-chaperone Cdc37-like n=1 Tax=Diadema antillarum TaxID=105358 RepID=UPI003A8AFB8C
MVDYSKWDHIEVSDDEDDTHPNIDTPSLFRWRHQARVDRMKEQEDERKAVDTETNKVKNALEDARSLLENLKTKGDEEGVKKAEVKLKELEDQEKKWREKEAEIEKKERLTPWNVDTLSKPGFEKTLINKYEKREEDLTEEEKEEKMANFVKKNEDLIKKYGMHNIYHDSERFLIDHPDLVCEDTANYLAIWCINLEVEEKHALMERVAHQTIVMQYLLELAKSMDRDPRSCIRPFFKKMVAAERQYQEAFDDELNSFKARVRDRAKARIERAYKEAEEEMEKEKQERLGPGGLDPVDVYESLPKELQECFDSKSITQLQETIAKMSPEDATYHMKRCVDSGLWVPGGGAKDEEEENGGDDQGKGAEGEEAEEEVYEEVDDKSTNLDAVD